MDSRWNECSFKISKWGIFIYRKQLFKRTLYFKLEFSIEVYVEIFNNLNIDVNVLKTD
jgi:hypothetical protein